MTAIDDVWGGPELQAWEPVQEIGRGGSGVVYLARGRVSHELRAVKLVIPGAAPDARADERVRREIDHCLALRHRNVVRTFAAGRAGPAYYLLMEHCAGGSLDAVVARSGPLDPARAARLLGDVLDGLEYAHTAPVRTATDHGGLVVEGLVHRDVKPSNVFLGPGDPDHSDGSVKVGDFGLAKAFSSAGLSGLTMTGSAAGTPAFMPRQQVLDFKYASPGVDVWSAAATAYYALSGHAPRDFPRGADPWLVVWETAPVPLADRRSEVPPALCAVIDDALDDSDELQFPTVPAFRAALAQAVPDLVPGPR